MLADIARVGVSKGITGAAFILLNLWLARALGLHDYGVLALCLSLVLLIDSIVGGSIDLAVLRSADADRPAPAAAYESAGLIVKVALAAAAGGVAAVVGEAAGVRLFGSGGGRVLFTLAVLTGAALLLLRSVQTRFQLRSQYGTYATTDLLHTLLRVALVAGVVLSGAGSVSLVLGGYAVAAIVTALVSGRQVLTRWQLDRARCAVLLRFAGTAATTFALGAIVARLDLFVLAFFSTPEDLGLFGLALTLAAVPEMLGTYLAPALTPRITRWCREGSFFPVFRRVQLALYALAAVGLVLGWLAAGWVVSAMFPPGYAGAIRLAQVLLVGGIAAFVTFPLTMHYVMVAAPRAFIIMDGLTIPLLVAAYVYAAGQHGALGVAYVTAGSKLLKATFMQGYAAWLARSTAGGGPEPALPMTPMSGLPLEASRTR